MKNIIKIVDSTLRDGNHTVNNKFSLEDIKLICRSLDKSNVDFIEVGYGYGLGYFEKPGYPSDEEIIKTALDNVENSEISLLVFPNRCDIKIIEKIKNLGIKNIRIATQALDFSPGIEYVKKAKNLSINVGAFLMMSHRASCDELLSQALIAKESGVDSICLTDSAGAMTPNEVFDKIKLIKNKTNLTIGFHTHDNLGLAIGNSITAINAGASYIDTALSGLGAGAGNTPTETLVAVLNKMNINNNISISKALDAANLLSSIVNKYGINLNQKENSILIGYSGVYSTFLEPAKKAAKLFSVDYKDILFEASKQNLIAGDEEKLFEIAHTLSI